MLYAVYRYLGRAWLGYALVFISLPIASGRFDSLNRYMLAAPYYLSPQPVAQRQIRARTPALYCLVSVLAGLEHCLLFQRLLGRLGKYYLISPISIREYFCRWPVSLWTRFLLL